ncbi:MAG: WYL domain-containing protein [Actinomycetota bacterium]|nr:WYL domain-containing protein [Actinomycetota bacterium]
MRRIERLVNLIAALLETSRPLTADDIRTTVAGYDQTDHEAFRRTFERDKASLREIGIPLEVVATDPFADRSDAYIIPKARYYLPQLDLEEDELAALQLAAQSLQGSREQTEAGVLKLSIMSEEDALPGPRVLWGSDVAAEQPVLISFYEALLDRRPVTFDYRSSDGSTSTRTVSLYGLVHRRGHWYAVGKDHHKDDIRTFRVERVHGEPEHGDDGYEIPDEFDASAYVGTQSWEAETPETTTAVVRFSKSMRWWAEQNLTENPSIDGPEGALDVQFSLGRPDALVSWVIEFAGDVTIVSPAELRDRLLARIEPYATAR